MDLNMWDGFCCEPYGHKRKTYWMYPMPYIGMRKFQWREMLKYNAQIDRFYFANSNLTPYHHISKPIGLNRWSVIRLITDVFGKVNKMRTNDKIIRADELWFTDQYLTGVLTKEYAEQHGYKHARKALSGQRLTRDGSKEHWINLLNTSFDDITDANCYHQDAFSNLNFIQELNRKLFDQAQQQLFDKYFFEYISARRDFYEKKVKS
jgi:hypothetical protein